MQRSTSSGQSPPGAPPPWEGAGTENALGAASVRGRRNEAHAVACGPLVNGFGGTCSGDRNPSLITDTEPKGLLPGDPAGPCSPAVLPGKP